MTSHDLNIAAEYCKRLFMLDRGQLVADGQPGDVLCEDLLQRVYQCEVRVTRDTATGVFNIFPAHRLDKIQGAKSECQAQ